MKKIISILSVCSLLMAVGCDDDNPENPLNTPAEAKIIEYASTDGQIVTPTSPNGFGARLLSNTYEKGEGVIKFGSAVTAIGYRAFLNCTTLQAVIIPPRVRDIEELAFSGCDNLLEVTIPSSVTEIGDGAFAYCENLGGFLGKFSTPDNRCLVMRGSLVAFAPAGLTTYTIPDGITEIEGSAFEGCETLTSIALPPTLREIDDRAFANCLTLSSLTIPSGLIEINTSTFEGCTALTTILLPATVKEIDPMAFKGCSALQSIYCAASRPPRIAVGSFDDIAADAVIYVPASAVATYQSAAVWSTYSSKIVGYEF